MGEQEYWPQRAQRTQNKNLLSFSFASLALFAANGSYSLSQRAASSAK